MNIQKFENFSKKVECDNCQWSWEIETDDNRPYWCHKCAYDNSNGKFYHKDLEKWKEEQTFISESVYNDNDIDVNKKFSDYNFNYIWSSVSNMIRHVLDRMNIEIIDDYEGFYRRDITLNNGTQITIKGNPTFEIRISKDFGTYRGGESLGLNNTLKDFFKILSKYYPIAGKSLKKMNENLPFNEEQVSENEVIRTFKQDTDSKEFVWHRDREDRIVESIGNTDWKIQIDNELPKSLNNVFIPKNIYHRVIKGTGDLKVKIKKLK